MEEAECSVVEPPRRAAVSPAECLAVVNVHRWSRGADSRRSVLGGAAGRLLPGPNVGASAAARVDAAQRSRRRWRTTLCCAFREIPRARLCRERLMRALPTIRDDESTVSRRIGFDRGGRRRPSDRWKLPFAERAGRCALTRTRVHRDRAACAELCVLRSDSELASGRTSTSRSTASVSAPSARPAWSTAPGVRDKARDRARASSRRRLDERAPRSRTWGSASRSAIV